MMVALNGRIGQVLLAVLGIVVGLGLIVGFSLPAALAGAWLLIGCLLWLIGV